MAFHRVPSRPVVLLLYDEDGPVAQREDGYKTQDQVAYDTASDLPTSSRRPHLCPFVPPDYVCDSRLYLYRFHCQKQPLVGTYFSPSPKIQIHKRERDHQTLCNDADHAGLRNGSVLRHAMAASRSGRRRQRAASPRHGPPDSDTQPASWSSHSFRRAAVRAFPQPAGTDSRRTFPRQGPEKGRLRAGHASIFFLVDGGGASSPTSTCDH